MPDVEYGNEMYYGKFARRYQPYITLERIKRYDDYLLLNDKEKEKECENAVREYFGHHKISRKWVSETILYDLISQMFSDYEVISHYRGKELEGLELDIWIPRLKLGIEYHGRQHFEPIKLFGGEDAFIKQVERDNRKKQLCHKLGYTLIEFTYRDKLLISTIKKRLPKEFK